MKWLGAAQKLIKQFADEVHAVATTAAADGVAMAGAAAVPALVQAGIPGGEGGGAVLASASAMPVQMQMPANVDPRARFLQHQLEAHARVNDAFAAAWDINKGLNRIFALPLSAMFVGALLAGAALWYVIISSGFYNIVGLASMMTATPLVLLMVVATVGDAYVDARASLLRPDVSLGLAKHVGISEAAIFAAALQRTKLGFDIVHVTVTTHRVLHVIGSMLILGVYLMPK